MGVSKNNGTPKSSILIGFSIINHPFWAICNVFWRESAKPAMKRRYFPANQGDIHGQLRDLLLFFHAFGLPTKSGPRFVFNGDFVDRGAHQLEAPSLLEFLVFRGISEAFFLLPFGICGVQSGF